MNTFFFVLPQIPVFAEDYLPQFILLSTTVVTADYN